MKVLTVEDYGKAISLEDVAKECVPDAVLVINGSADASETLRLAQGIVSDNALGEKAIVIIDARDGEEKVDLDVDNIKHFQRQTAIVPANRSIAKAITKLLSSSGGRLIAIVPVISHSDLESIRSAQDDASTEDAAGEDASETHIE